MNKQTNFPFKPYFKPRTVSQVTEGVWTNTRARLDSFKSWRAEGENGDPVRIFETWRCEIDQRDSKGGIEREFNIGKDKEFEVPAELIETRRAWLAKTPERFAKICSEAQEYADKQREPMAVWQYEEGMFHYRELRMTEPAVNIEIVIYPINAPAKTGRKKRNAE